MREPWERKGVMETKALEARLLQLLEEAWSATHGIRSKMVPYPPLRQQNRTEAGHQLLPLSSRKSSQKFSQMILFLQLLRYLIRQSFHCIIGTRDYVEISNWSNFLGAWDLFKHCVYKLMSWVINTDMHLDAGLWSRISQGFVSWLYGLSLPIFSPVPTYSKTILNRN